MNAEVVPIKGARYRNPRYREQMAQLQEARATQLERAAFDKRRIAHHRLVAAALRSLAGFNP